ncbi:MAG: hypothetical protein AAF733_10195 [Verrucomicrobiota bacterium]
MASWVVALHAFDPSEQDDSLALVRHFKVPEETLEMPMEGGLIGDEVGLTVSLMGGADVYRLQEFGFFEFYLQAELPEKMLRVRNLGWPGDTVYRQQRPMYFFTEQGDTREGSESDGREKIEPGIFVLSFGKMESLDGLERLGEFEEAYDRMITGLQKYRQRIALIKPSAFHAVGPAAELAEDRNLVLEQYGNAIEKLAEEKGLILVTWEHFDSAERLPHPNGVYLSASELRDLAIFLGTALHDGERVEGPLDSGKYSPFLYRLILEKNHLWDQYYRPTNWAFLYGDRQHVPSSRDHKDSDRRWFVEELNRIPFLIEEKEAEIWALATEVE